MCSQYRTHGGTHPAVGQEGLALRDLVHVVQFAVVDPAGVDVEVRAEQRDAHHRALQVPAGRAPAPRGVPAQHAAPSRLLGAPQREVGLAAAARHVLDPGGFALALGVQLGQLPVAGVLGGVEVQAGRQAVRVAALLQGGRELDHLRHVGAGPRVLGGGQDVQRGQVVEEHPGVELGDLQHRTPFPGRGHLHLVLAGVGVGDRVPHVGDVDHVPDADALPAQRAPHGVGEHVGAHVAQVLVGVHGRAAAVHAGHVAGRDEVLHPPAEGVVEAKGMAVRHGPPGYRRRRSLKSWSRRIRRSASARCRSSSVPLAR